MKLWGAALLQLVLLLVAVSVAAQELSGEAVRERWRSRLSGRHFTADVILTVDLGDSTEQRKLLVWRDDADGTRERLMARFERPLHMRGFALLYLENRDRANDYFIYQPELDRVRRISTVTASQDIYGVDLEYIGFGVAQSVPTEIVSASSMLHEGRPSFRLVERALTPNPRFDRRVSIVDASTYLPHLAEYYREGAIVLVARTEAVEEVQGVPTPRRIVFDRPLAGTQVLMQVVSIDYEAPIPGVFFSTLALLK